MSADTATPQTVFVSAHINLTGGRGRLLGGTGAASTASGELQSPHDDLVLWHVIEQVAVEKQLLERSIVPAENGQSVSYRYTVAGGAGGLFPIDEAGHFEAELIAAFAPPSFLTEVGQVQIISTAVPQDSRKGAPAKLALRKSYSSAQLEGRLIRLPDIDNSPIWHVENGIKRPIASPTAGRLRFGESWRRLIQPLATATDAALVPDGPALTIAEAGEGKLVYSWPAPEVYLIQGQQKRRIDDPEPIIARFGDHWRIKLIHLAPQELAMIPEGEPITTMSKGD